MVKTRTEVKLKIKKWIEKNNKSFTTQEIKKEITPIASNINLSPNRLVKYIQATGKVDYDKNKKKWKVRLKPFTRLSQD